MKEQRITPLPSVGQLSADGHKQIQKVQSHHVSLLSNAHPENLSEKKEIWSLLVYQKETGAMTRKD